MIGGSLPPHEIDQQAAGCREAGVTTVELRAVAAYLTGMAMSVRFDSKPTYTKAELLAILLDSVATIRSVHDEISRR